MKPCPQCDGLTAYNSYFGRDVCPYCGWMEPFRQSVEVMNHRGIKKVSLNLLKELLGLSKAAVIQTVYQTPADIQTGTFRVAIVDPDYDAINEGANAIIEEE